MRYLLLFFLPFFLSFTLLSQSGGVEVGIVMSPGSTPEVFQKGGIVYNQKTKKPVTGVVKYYNMAALRVVAHYKNGILHGERIVHHKKAFFHDYTPPKRYIEYFDHGIQDKIDSFYPNGKQRKIIKLQKKRPEPVATPLQTKPGDIPLHSKQPLLKIPLKYLIQWDSFHPDGKKRSHYNPEKRITTIWREDGTIKGVVTYKKDATINYTLNIEKHHPYRIEGIKDGPDIQWHPNGVIQSEYHYKNGKRHGAAYEQNKYGDRYATYSYKNGKRDGLHTWKYPRKRWAETLWRDGFIVSQTKYVFPEQRLKYEYSEWYPKSVQKKFTIKYRFYGKKISEEITRWSQTGKVIQK